jgi:hypothetical protein
MKVLEGLKVYEVNDGNYKTVILRLLGKNKAPTICIAKRDLVWEVEGKAITHEEGRFYPELSQQKEELVGAEQAEYFSKDGNSRAWVTTLNGKRLVIELKINKLSLLLVFR